MVNTKATNVIGFLVFAFIVISPLFECGVRDWVLAVAVPALRQLPTTPVHLSCSLS